MRKYRGFIYTSDDIIEVEYYSNYRNFSKANKEDLLKEVYKRYDRSITRDISQVEFGYLI